MPQDLVIGATLNVVGTGVCASDLGQQIWTTVQLPGSIEFSVTGASPETDRRIILSNARREYAYSHFQSLGGQDGAVPMFLRALAQGGQPQAAQTVYLRIADPPDTAAYTNLPQNRLAHIGDNYGPPAVLAGNGITTTTTAGVYQAVSGANGEIDFTLRLQPGTAAGDNYQIEASFAPTFPSGSSWTSGTLTAWKRSFVEKKLMFRRGSPLATDAPAGVTNITVENDAISSTGDHFHNGDSIVLLHAPPFGQPKNSPGAFYQGLYQIAAHPHAFTAHGPQPGPNGSSITTDGTTKLVSSNAHFNGLKSGDVIGIGTEFRYVISTQGTDVAFVNAPFSFIGTTSTYTVGDPNLVDDSFHHYLRLALDRALTESYQREPAIDPRTTPATIALALNDGVAKLSAASLPPPSADYFTASDDLLVGAAETQPAHAFPSAFTEYIVLPWQPTAAAGAVVPRVRLLKPAVAQQFIDKWFALSDPQPVAAGDPYRSATDPLTWFRYAAPPNHQLLIVADTDALTIADGRANGFLAVRATGATREMGSVLVRGNTEHAVGDSGSPIFNADVDTVLRRTTVHELTHQWQTNRGGFNDHCYPEVAYTSTALYPQTVGPLSPPAGIEFCLMAFAEDSTSPPVPQMRAPWNSGLNINMVQYFYRAGLTHYHAPSATNGFQSEYLAIRNASDPWHP